MGLLDRTTALALVASTAACYEPAVRNCTLECNATDDCASGQVCGSAGYCVDNAAITCSTGGGIRDDAGTPAVIMDARVIDAGPGDAGIDAPIDAPPDAPTTGTLILQISGNGRVDIEGIATCTSSCEYTLPLGAAVTLRADAGGDFEFDGWTGALCPDDDDATCTFVMPLSASLSARFKKD